MPEKKRHDHAKTASVPVSSQGHQSPTKFSLGNRLSSWGPGTTLGENDLLEALSSPQGSPVPRRQISIVAERETEALQLDLESFRWVLHRYPGAIVSWIMSPQRANGAWPHILWAKFSATLQRSSGLESRDTVLGVVLRKYLIPSDANSGAEEAKIRSANPTDTSAAMQDPSSKSKGMLHQPHKFLAVGFWT